jgi:hypothetical protein
MTKREVQDLVDQIGIVKAQIAPQLEALKALEEKIKLYAADIPSDGTVALEGALFRATVSFYEQDKLDMKAVRAKLTAQFIRAHTTQTPVVKLSVKAKVLAPAEQKAA